MQRGEGQLVDSDSNYPVKQCEVDLVVWVYTLVNCSPVSCKGIKMLKEKSMKKMVVAV